MKQDNKINNATYWMMLDAIVVITHAVSFSILVLLPAFYFDKYPNLFPGKTIILIILSGIALLISFVITKHMFRWVYPRIASIVSSALPVKISDKECKNIWFVCYWGSALLSIIVLAICMIFVLELNAFNSSRFFIASALSVGIIAGSMNLILPAFTFQFLHYKSEKK